jgi:hypothetical protein
MAENASRTRAAAPLTAIAVLAVAIAVLVTRIPAVQGLGSRVRLPIFHGGSTWVNLAMFTLMGVAALGYLITKRNSVYAWEYGFRAVAAPMWLVNSVLGVIAALNTWDFSASKEPPILAVRQDPRLMAQFGLLLGVVVLLALDRLVLETRPARAIADLAFTAVMWVMISDLFLNPEKRALHPDSPVLNSGWEIKLPFFAIVACIFAIATIFAWWVGRRIAAE